MMKPGRNIWQRGGEQSRTSQGACSAHVTRAIVTHAGGKEPPLIGMDFHGGQSLERRGPALC